MDDIATILRDTGLFNSLSAAELSTLVESADYIELPPNWVIMREGEIGNELFVIIDGSVQIYTQGQDGEVIVLDKLEAGGYVGEQALLPTSQGRRNATVRTSGQTTLLRIHKQDFQSALAKDNPLQIQLSRIGEEQVKRNLVKQSALFRTLQMEESRDWYREVTYADQEVIFHEGDPGDHYYLILDGRVSVLRKTGAGQQLLGRLEVGQGFGELALLQREPRRATVVANGDVRLLRIDGDVFRNLYEKKPELRKYIQTLRKVYLLAGQGMVTQHTGRFLDMDSITTAFHLDDDRTIFSSHVIGHDIFFVHVVQASDKKGLEEVRYQDAELNIDREVVLDNAVPVRITSYGLWEELGQVHNMVLTNASFTAEEIQRFRQSGHFFTRKQELAATEDTIVCECLQVDYGTILASTQQGNRSVQAVSEVLGVTTVCGACRPQIREMLGQGGWTPVTVVEELEIIPGIRSFRFAPYGHTFKPAKPGQHIVIQAPIEGVWVQRPYTITSAANEVASREVTIKREPHGRFSNWIFDQRTPELILRISEPQGDFFACLDRPNPIVCLVAGIGVTPALAILRTMLQEGSRQEIHLDYSVTTAEDFIHRNALQEMADDHENLHLNFRVTEEHGRVSQSDVNMLVDQYPSAEFFICGPESYEKSIEDYLMAAQIPADRIKIERFTHVGDVPQELTFWQRLSTRYYLPIGLGLFALFLLQDAFRLKWPWLENLQGTESLKRWTGLFLTLYILLQWYLPYLRWRGRLKASARQYHWHKIQGAFSPLVYYVHSTEFGYAYTLVLSSVYFANFVLGLFNQEVLAESSYRRQYRDYWLPAHIVLSVSTVSLILYHIYIAFAYK